MRTKVDPRKPVLTKGAMVILLGTIATLESNLGKLKKGSEDLESVKNEYQKQITYLKPLAEELSDIEEILLQIAARDNIGTPKLNIHPRGYIYGRVDFFRKNNRFQDIRTIVGNTKDHGEDLEVIKRSPTRIRQYKEKLVKQMNKEIEKSITLFKEKYPDSTLFENFIPNVIIGEVVTETEQPVSAE